MPEPKFVPPPEHIFRRQHRIDPGHLALFGALLAFVFMALVLGFILYG